MAFGANTPGLVPLIGPNGTLQIPSQFAGMFPQQPPIVPQVPTFAPGEVEGAALPPPPAVTPGAALPPTAFAPPPTAPSTPAPQPEIEMEPEQVRPPNLADATAKANEAIGGIRERQQTEQPKNALDMTMGALADKRAVIQAEGEVEAALGREEANVYASQEEADAAATKQRDAERERSLKEQAATRAELASAQDAYVNHKVDQGRWWSSRSTGQKIMAGIGLALGAAGGALVARDRGGPVVNPALDIITGAIQEDTRLQLADRDKLAATVGMKRDALGDLRQQYQDGEAAYQGVLSGNYRRAELKIKAAAATAKDPLAKLKLENLSADVGLKAAEAQQMAEAQEIAARQQKVENERADSANSRGWAELNLRRDELKLRRDEIAADRRAAEAAARAKGDGDALTRLRAEDKDLEERGIRDPSTGEYLLNPEGLAMTQRAAEIEKAADAQKDPNVAAVLRNEASIIRRDARTRFAAKGRNPDKASDVSQAYAAALTVHGLLSDIKDLRNNAGWESDISKTPEYQAMKSRYSSAKAITGKALQLGAMDAGTNEVLEQIFGGDPTQWRGTDASIDATLAMLEQRTGNLLASEGGFRGTFKFPASSFSKSKNTAVDEASKKIAGSKTPAEIEEAGRTSKVARYVYGSFGSETPRDKAARREADASLSTELPGVSEEQAAEIRKLTKIATGEDSKAAAAARTRLVTLATDKRPGIRAGTFAAMQEAGLDKELETATAALPEGERDAAQVVQKFRAREETVGDLEARAKSGEGAAMIRLAQLARAKGPQQQDAASALMRVSGRRKR